MSYELSAAEAARAPEPTTISLGCLFGKFITNRFLHAPTPRSNQICIITGLRFCALHNFYTIYIL